MSLQVGPLLHLGPVITLVPSTSVTASFSNHFSLTVSGILLRVSSVSCPYLMIIIMCKLILHTLH